MGSLTVFDLRRTDINIDVGEDFKVACSFNSL